MVNITKTEEVLWYMRLNGSITQEEATKSIGDMRLSSIIYRLRLNGYTIETIHHNGEKVYPEYVLIREPEASFLLKFEKKCLEYMREHGSITITEAARECGIYRLADTIHALRQKGYAIETTFINECTPQSKAIYVLKSESKMLRTSAHKVL